MLEKEKIERTLTVVDRTNVQVNHSSTWECLLPDEISDLPWKFREAGEGVEVVEGLREEFLVCVW